MALRRLCYTINSGIAPNKAVRLYSSGASKIVPAPLAIYPMSKPQILIPTPIQDKDKLRFTMRATYINSIIAGGGVPVLAPVNLDENTLHDLYATADGVLLTGGDDVNPAHFGETAHAKTSGIDPDRDSAEFWLTRWAAADNKPLFAICRGIQAMNVALGGTLVQDIPSQWRNPITHDGNYYGPTRDEIHHDVCVEPHTQLAQMLGAGDVGTNSFHHQALKRVADGLVVTARAKDGVIEAVEMPDHRFFVGVQWHPEEMAATRANMLRLFQTFIAATVVPELT
jgi:putative glutamine amidotransferase